MASVYRVTVLCRLCKMIPGERRLCTGCVLLRVLERVGMEGGFVFVTIGQCLL